MAVSLTLGAKIAGAAVLAAVGVTGLVLSPSHSARAGSAQVWIDAPLGGSYLPVGPVTVLAHASATQPTGSIRLLVDGRDVAETGSVTRDGTLVYGSVRWLAPAGSHVLVADDGHGHQSRSVTVVIGAAISPSLVATAPARPTPSATPSTSARPTPSRTPSSSASSPARIPPPSSSAPAPPPSSATRPAPSTSAPTAPPVLAITKVTVSPTVIDNICGPTQATVTATVTGASGVTAYYGGNTYPMTLTPRSGSTWTVQIPSSDFTQNQAAAPVSVEAVHPGEKAVDLDSSSTLSVQTCKP